MANDHVAKLNNDIKNAVNDRKNSSNLDFAALITASAQNKLSVVATYKPCRGEGFVTIGETGGPIKSVPDNRGVYDYSSYYYGVSPLFNAHAIIDAISKFRLKNRDELEDFVFERGSWFCLHEGQENYLLPFAKYVCVFLTSLYGIPFGCSAELAKQLDDYDESGTVVRCEPGLGENVRVIAGCPTVELIELFGDRHFTVPNTQGKPKAAKRVFVESDDPQALNVQEIYSNKDNIRLIRGSVFYSGVLFRPLEVSPIEPVGANRDIKSLDIFFERSTFGTVVTLDNKLFRHLLLTEEELGKISEMLKKDDEARKGLTARIWNAADDAARIKAVNDYLSESMGVNQIAVSGNLVTSDNMLLFSRRGKKGYDSGDLYPGVNGNAEIWDDKVSLYHDSVYEDSPSVFLNAGRIDFNNEIQRETIAELGIGSNGEKWGCCGLSIMGRKPGEDALNEARRMHFNIIFERECADTFSHIQESQKHATESFESSQILGTRISVYKSTGDRVWKGFGKLLRRVISSKSTIDSIVLLFLLFADLVIAHETSFDVLSAAFALLIIVELFYKAVEEGKKFLRARRLTTRRNVVLTSESSDIEADNLNYFKQIYTDSDKGPSNGFHPVSYIAYVLHIAKVLADFGSDA